MVPELATTDPGPVEIMMICSMAGQALMVWPLRRDIAWHGLKPFVVGAAISLPIVPSWP